MMPFRRLTVLALLAGLTACDENPSGPSVSDAFLAARFEELARARTDQGDGAGALAARGAAHALRLGIRPAQVNISVDGVTEQYLAFETEYAYGEDDGAGPLPPIPIAARTMIAWRGGQPDRFLVVHVAGDTGTFAPPCLACLTAESNVVGWLLAFGMLSERGRAPLVAVAGGVRTTRQSLGSECQVPKRPAFIPGLEPVSCHHAMFFARFTMTVDVQFTTLGTGVSTTSSAAQSRVVQMAGHDVPGVRILYPPLPTL
jgi:hypothetical protein